MSGTIYVSAQEFQSADFTDLNPVFVIQGGKSTSTNFQLIGGTGQTVIGESTSSNFSYRSGFYYFPIVTSPTVAATAGDTQVSLTWTAAAASLGWSVGGYQVGQATNSTGPFTYTNVGVTLSNTRSSLTNGTTYYFVVRVLDNFSNPIASSSVVSATPTGATTPTGGGGGGGGNVYNTVTIIISGQTAPGATVIILDGVNRVGEVNADQQGNFSFNYQTFEGTKTLTIFAEREGSERTGFVTQLVQARAGETITIKNIILPPFLSTDLDAVKQGEPITFYGFTAPGDEIFLIFEHDGKEFFESTPADAFGEFSFLIDTDKFIKGVYTIRARVRRGGQDSVLSRPINLIIGDKSIIKDLTKQCAGPTDYNCDNRVDLVDFSILLYWFDKTSVPAAVDLNGDKRADLTDFSILMYYWTG